MEMPCLHGCRVQLSRGLQEIGGGRGMESSYVVMENQTSWIVVSGKDLLGVAVLPHLMGSRGGGALWLRKSTNPRETLGWRGEILGLNAWQLTSHITHHGSAPEMRLLI